LAVGDLVMDFLQTILLGLIQGLTEWLPVSSTGHLRLAETFMGLQLPVVFDGLLHVGTVFVTFVFFRKDIGNVLVSLSRRDFSSENGRLIPLIIVGTLPTVIVGMFFGDMIDAFFKGFVPLAGAFVFCGIMLYLSKTGKETDNNLSLTDALVLGTAQGIAIIPGVSRSGLTIATALLLGVRREKAFAFSFLLSVPAILGAVSLTFYNERDALVTSGIGLTEILVGVFVSMAVGYLALKLLGRLLQIKKFHLFGFYCWIVAIVLIGLSLGGF
jgi:undecaprenyl-diphosphatase